MKAQNFDKKFNDGESILHHPDMESIRKPNLEQKRVNVDFPMWMISKLDREAKRLGVTRQSVIKMWLAERLDDMKS